MEIKRIDNIAIKNSKNKEEKINTFYSSIDSISTIKLDSSLFTHLVSKYYGSDTEVQATDAIIKVEFDGRKDILDKVVTLDNTEYVFFMATAGDIKKSSAFFIKKSDQKELEKVLMEYTTGDLTKRLEGESVVVNKVGAYRGFIFTGSTRLKGIKPRTVIIEEPKYDYIGLHTVIKDVATLEFGEEIVERTREKNNALVFSDGQGIADSRFMDRVRIELNKIKGTNIKHMDYCSFRTYPLAGKGIVVNVDIPTQLRRVNEKYGDTDFLKNIDGVLKVRDIFGDYHNIDEIDLLINTSQTKLVKYFSSNADIKQAVHNIPEEYRDIITDFYVCKHSTEKVKTSSLLGYQFLQALNLTYNELMELTKDNLELLEQALTDPNAMLHINDLIDVYDDEEEELINTSNAFDVALDLVRIDEEFLRDKTVLEQIRKLFKSKIDKHCYGRVPLKDFSYRLAVQDPQVYLNFIATRDMDLARDKECLQAGEYHVTGVNNDTKIVMGRNPLSGFQEMIRFKNTRNEFIDTLGYNKKDMIIFNAYDCTPVIMSGCDFDADIIGVIECNKNNKNEIIYNSVIELDTPKFFNTLDGQDKKQEYNKRNVVEMIKKTAKTGITALALDNCGIMSSIAQNKFLDKRDNEEYYKIDIFNKELEKIKLENPTLEGYEQNKLAWDKVNELLNDETLVNTLITKSDSEIKEHITQRHRKYRHMEYTILIAQQQSIDESKCGVPVEKNIKQYINSIKSRPYFLKFTGDREFNRCESDVLNTYAYKMSKYLNSKRVELVKDMIFKIDENVTETNNFKNTNVICNKFKNHQGIVNDDRVKVIVGLIKPRLETYVNNIRSYRLLKNDKETYNLKHSQNNFEFNKSLQQIYIGCKNGVEGYTLDDMVKAVSETICNSSIGSKIILDFLGDLLTYVILHTNSKKKVFISGEHEGGEVITIGKQKYTIKYKDIEHDEIENIIKKHSEIQKQKEEIKLGNIVNIQTDAESNLQIGSKYYLKRNEVNTYLFQMIDSDGVIVLNNARVKQGTQEYKSGNELAVVIENYQGLSKNEKYDKWIAKVAR